ncbi:MAG: Verru_Chthon cassette protein A [Verrucomicrobiales bacterium]|nr:Verru_Chthon cassette protein A [Verrucomicrobiales bacterium]
MKTHPKVPGASPTLESRRGVALITVLTIISLCTILVLTFFQLAQNEMIASDSYNSGLEAQQVAEQAVNLVIKQIREATSDGEMAWASQPGVIRTWGKRGDFGKGYKLYSDEQMVETDERSLVEGDYNEFENWDALPAQFVDLNEPVIRGTKVYYPIVDPSARTNPKWRQSLGEDSDGVEGFMVLPEDSGNRLLAEVKRGTAGGVVPSGPMSASVKEATGGAFNTLPMPVKWIYQLKDGTLGVLDNAGRFKATSGGNEPSAANPMVARFAFWADDETSKLNPNVHAGGATWTTPMASGRIDRDLGRYQPLQHEWQRYPGHPATTHLAPVIAPGIPDITLSRDNMEMIFNLVPRVVGGGSVSGTKKANFNDPGERNGLIADTDRLYATLDEFFLEPGHKSSSPNRSATLRDANEFPDASKGGRGGSAIDWEVMQEHAERTKFFLSVVSRAPETTMFNTPRVSLWPTHWDGAAGHSDQEHWTPFDRLIRFCGEMGGVEYHFQRYDSDSSINDVRNITRNIDLLKYLDNMLAEDIPGFQGSFESKYGRHECRQIITQIFDYIRAVNLHDDSLYGEDWKRAFSGPGFNKDTHITYTNGRISDANERHIHKGHGQVTPIKIGGDDPENQVAGLWSEETKGFGRFYTLMDIGVVIINCADGGGVWDDREEAFKSPYVGVARYSNPGTTKYNVGWVEPASTRWTYSNVPPLMGGGLTSQYMANLAGKQGLEGEDLRAYAQLETNWNWQLAWLDPDYAKEMPRGKFRTPSNPDICHLKPDEQCLQAAIVWNMFSPSLGWVPINPDFFLDIKVDGMNFEDPGTQVGTSLVGKGPVDFGWSPSLNGKGVDLMGALDNNSISNTAWVPANVQVSSIWHDRHYGGTKPATYFLVGHLGLGEGIRHLNNEFNQNAGLSHNGRYSPIDFGFGDASQKGDKEYNRYYYMTRPFRNKGKTVRMSKGIVKMNIWSSGQEVAGRTLGSAPQSGSQLVQQIDIPFDEFEVLVPKLAGGTAAYINEFNALERGKIGPMEYWSLSRDGANPVIATRGRLSKANGHHALFHEGDVVRSVGVRHGDVRLAAVQPKVLASASVGGRLSDGGGDPENPRESVFMPHYLYNQQSARMAHGFMYTTGGRFAGAASGDRSRWLVRFRNADPARAVYHSDRIPYLMTHDLSVNVQRYGDFDSGFGNVVDGSYINKPDEGNTHSLFRRTDPNALVFGNFEMARDYGDFPYFVRDWIHEAGTPSYFSPNRIMSSPGQLGSLPVGTTMEYTYSESGRNRTFLGHPWRTLLFRPNVEGGVPGPVTEGSANPQSVNYSSHPGAGTQTDVADHLLMDMFWMPVVEPYAISEPLSTAGKVNLNYQILPFRHIHRSTAVRGLFKSEYLMCVPNTWVPDAKIGVGRGQRYHWRDNPYGGTLESKSLRAIIVEDDTLAQFEEKFNDNRNPTLFRSASEICEVHLIADDIAKRMQMGGSAAQINTFKPTVSEMKNGQYWAMHATVGENARERNYSNIYARATTKSNTFKVHYRAQILRKGKADGVDHGKWDPLLDQVVGEYRGSSIVERYVEPNDPEIPDYAKNFGSRSTPTLDQFYKFRVVHPTRFAP